MDLIGKTCRLRHYCPEYNFIGGWHIQKQIQIKVLDKSIKYENAYWCQMVLPGEFCGNDLFLQHDLIVI